MSKILSISQRRTQAVHVIMSVIVLGVAWRDLPANVARNPLSTDRFPPFYYHEIVSLSEQWGAMQDEPVIAMGTKKYLNNVLPTLLPETQIFFYRNVRTMMRQNNIPLAEAEERQRVFGSLIGSNVPFPVAWQMLDEYGVEYILADNENTRLVRMLATEVPERFILVQRTQHYRLYRLDR